MIKILKVSDKRHSYGASNLADCKFKDLRLNDILQNFVTVFGTNEVIVILDNSSKQTYDTVKEFGFSNIIETQLGPHDSTLYIFDKIVNEFPENETVYICEDDYWHLENSEAYLLDGLTKSDYVTLYDSLDKYINNGNNPFITEGGERTLLYLTKLSHWKYTNATTMTFAAKVSTFKRDYDCLRRNYTSDFRIFTELRSQGKTLSVCVPGRSGHIGYEMPPFIDWDKLMTNKLATEIRSEHDTDLIWWNKAMGRL